MPVLMLSLTSRLLSELWVALVMLLLWLNSPSVVAVADPIPVEEMSRKDRKLAEGTVLAIEGPPEGTVLSIVETMPVAPSMDRLQDTYSQEKTEDDGSGAAVPVVTAAFFSPDQLEVLNAQPMPQDRPATVEGVVVAVVPPEEGAPPVPSLSAAFLVQESEEEEVDDDDDDEIEIDCAPPDDE